MKAAKEFLNDKGYGTGTNFSIATVAGLLKQYAEQYCEEKMTHEIRKHITAFFDFHNPANRGFDEIQNLIDEYLTNKQQEQEECSYYKKNNACIAGCGTDSCVHHPNNR